MKALVLAAIIAILPITAFAGDCPADNDYKSFIEGRFDKPAFTALTADGDYVYLYYDAAEPGWYMFTQSAEKGLCFEASGFLAWKNEVGLKTFDQLTSEFLSQAQN